MRARDAHERTEQTWRWRAMTSRRSGRPAGRPGGDALTALQLVTAALVDRKGIDPMVLDLRGLTAAADFFVIVSGTSDAHVRWVLLDYVDFVVHVFHPELREFYQLERLWGDAPVLAAGAPEGGAKG